MKIFINLIVLLLCSQLAISNTVADLPDLNEKIDSLKLLVDRSPRKAIIIANQMEERLFTKKESLIYSDFLLSKGLAYQRLGIQDSALECFQNAHSIAKEQSNPSYLIRSHSNIAALSIQLELCSEAHLHLQSALSLIIKHPDESHHKGEVYTNIGLCFSEMNKTDSAFFYYNKAIKYYEDIQDSTDLAVALDNLGQYYDKVGMPDIALKYYIRAASVNKKNSNFDHLLNNYNNIGLYYKSKEEFEKADEYFGLVDSIAQKHSFNRSLAINYYNRANLYYQIGWYKQANIFYKKSIALCEKLDLTYGLIINKISYSKWFAENNDLSKAEQLWSEVESLIQQNGYFSLLVNLNEVKSDAYQNIGKFEEALTARNIQITLEDSLKDQSHKELMEDLIKFYEVDRKNRIIDFQKTEIKEKNKRLWIYGIAFVVFFLLSLVLFLAWNHIRNKNRMLFQHIKRISNLEKDKREKPVLLENEDKQVNKQFQEIFKKFETLLNEEELYLDPKITRLKFAQLSHTNEKYLSQAIRENTSLSLSEYINQIRTNKAMEVLSEMTEFNINSLITQSGFQSERTFFRVFKKNTGLTPSQFYKLSNLDKKKFLGQKQTSPE